MSGSSYAVDSRNRRVYSMTGARWKSLGAEDVVQVLVNGGFRREDVILPPEALVPHVLALNEVALLPLDTLEKVASYLEPVFIKPEILAQKQVMARKRAERRRALTLSEVPPSTAALEDDVDSEETLSGDPLRMKARRQRQVVDEDSDLEEVYGVRPEGSVTNESATSAEKPPPGVKIVDRFEDIPSSSAPRVVPRRPGKEIAKEGVDGGARGIIKSWNRQFNHDPKLFRCTSVHSVMSREVAREMNHAVVFYLSHFEAGLRLPVDPFMVEVMIATNTVPVDWGLTTVRAMVVFITLCRSLSFEPTLNLFRHYFLLTVNQGRLQGKKANGALQLWESLPKKNRSPDSNMLVIESVEGWTFPVASKEPKSLGSLRVSLNDYELAAKRSIEMFLGKCDSADERGYGTQRVINFRQLGVKNEALRLSGIWRGAIEGVEPRCHSFEVLDSYYPGWIVHINDEGHACFSENCTYCAGDWENCTVIDFLDKDTENA